MTKSIRILVVEDSKTQAMYLKLLLEQEGYTVSLAHNGQKGLAAVENDRPTLVISDVVMPEMTGYDMCRALKNNPETAGIPVILLTSLSESEDILKGIEARADYYLTKPFDEGALLNRVKEILSHPCRFPEHEHWEDLTVTLKGRQHTVRSSTPRIMNLLLSTYENAVQRNAELIKAQEKLGRLNEALEKRIYEVKVSENRFRSLVRTIPDIVYRIDEQGRFTFINEAIIRLGYAPEELIGEHFSRIIIPSDVERVDADSVLKNLKGVETGTENAPKLFNERRSGERKTTGLEICLLPRYKKAPLPGFVESLSPDFIAVEVNSSGMWEINYQAKNKEFLGTVGVIRDISSRKKVEKKLAENEAHLQTIFDYAMAGIIVIDSAKHVIVDANPMAVRMIGMSKKEIVGQVCHRFICPEEAENCPITDLNETIDNCEQVLVTATGTEIPILKTVTPVILKGRPHLLESFVDIRRLKDTEEALKSAHEDLEKRVEQRTQALRNSQAQLIQAEKLGALGTLTAGIAHELNNPMMGMLNFAQYCIRHTPEDNKIYSVLQDMERETKRSIKIVRNLQTFSRMDSLGQEQDDEGIECQQVIHRITKLLSYRFEKEQVAFRVTISDDCPKMRVNESSIQQVFLNLISNALDAVKPADTKEIDVNAWHAKGFIIVQVSDSGERIPESLSEKIFDPFFTTKPVGKGTGLGLWVSQSIVEACGGKIKYGVTQEGKKAFTVQLPV